MAKKGGTGISEGEVQMKMKRAGNGGFGTNSSINYWRKEIEYIL
jgi:hypothetical protein